MDAFALAARARRAAGSRLLQLALVAIVFSFAALQPVESAFAHEDTQPQLAFGETIRSAGRWRSDLHRQFLAPLPPPAAEAAPTVAEAVIPEAPLPEPAPEPVPEAAPEPQLEAPPAAPAHPPVQAAWIAGYRDGGGIEEKLPMAMCMIFRESTWNPLAVNRVGPFYGLGQFLMSTWNSVGGGDWRDPYTQGLNFARNWNKSNPATEWPKAYRLCLGVTS
jgi:hypothetical protein